MPSFRPWNSNQWQRLIQLAAMQRPHPIQMAEFRQKWGTASQPAALADALLTEYVVKALQTGHTFIHRSMVSEQVVCYLGKCIDAPVVTSVLVEIPQLLIDNQPELRTPYVYQAGVAHGALRIPDCSDRSGFGQFANIENKPRYALLAILYGLIGASDHQVIFENQPPNLVHSHDHGHFFPGGPNWSVDSLKTAGITTIDSNVVSSCGLTEADITAAACRLYNLSNKNIAIAVSLPPNDWQFSMEERCTMAAYLASRRDILISSLLPTRSAPCPATIP